MSIESLLKQFGITANVETKSESSSTTQTDNNEQQTSNSTSILDASFYQDDMNYDAQTAILKLQNDSQFESIYGNNNATKMGSGNSIIHGNQTVSGLECVANGGRYKIEVGVDTDNDGKNDTMEEVSAAEAMARSFDCEADLYIEAKLMDIIAECGTKFYDGSGFLSDYAIDKLKESGISVGKINNRTYTFSMLDNEGNVLKDGEGEASIMWGDWVIPDGYAQGAENNLSSLLDMMGYDCISRADFTSMGKAGDNGTELYNYVIKQVEQKWKNGEYDSSKNKLEDMYGGVKSSFNPSFASSDSKALDVDVLGEEYKKLVEQREQFEKQNPRYKFADIKTMYQELKNRNLSAIEITREIASKLNINADAIREYVEILMKTENVRIHK